MLTETDAELPAMRSLVRLLTTGSEPSVVNVCVDPSAVPKALVVMTRAKYRVRGARDFTVLLREVGVNVNARKVVIVDVRIAVLKSARVSYSKATVVAYPFGLTTALRVAFSASTEVEAFVTDVGGPTAGITSGNQPDFAVLFNAVYADNPPQHHTRSYWSSAQVPEIETAMRERTMSFGMYGVRYVFPPREVPVPSS